MSDILIRGMEMPRNCEECDVKVVCKNYWKLIREQYTRPSWCPLVPVQAHGDLIDRAELWVEINKICDRRDAGIITDLACLQQILSAVRHAPTIIQADRKNIPDAIEERWAGIYFKALQNIIPASEEYER